MSAPEGVRRVARGAILDQPGTYNAIQVLYLVQGRAISVEYIRGCTLNIYIYMRISRRAPGQMIAAFTLTPKRILSTYCDWLHVWPKRSL